MRNAFSGSSWTANWIGCFLLLPAGAHAVSSSPDWSFDHDAIGDHIVGACAGDVNGDGYDDLILGSTEWSAYTGKAWLVLGGPNGPANVPIWSKQGSEVDTGFGTAVASAGDTNGDGRDDVIIGSPYQDGGQADEGRATVYLGSASGGLFASPVWFDEPDKVGANYGWSVDGGGDINEDGRQDIVVGAPNLDDGQTDEGRVYLYYGTSSGPSVSADWSVASNSTGAKFGWSVAIVGDVNGDGDDEILVGAPGYSNGQAGEGRAYLYSGNPLVPVLTWSVEGDFAGAEFGHSVADAGDVNNDGYGDVVIGAPGFSVGAVEGGRAYLYLGGPGGLATSPAWIYQLNQAGADFGTCVASPGDVDGDGFSDVLVGAPFYDGAETGEGRVWLFRGRPSGLGGQYWTETSGQAGARLGWFVAGGDTDRDHRDDLILTAFNYDNPETDEGIVWVYFGGLNTTDVAEDDGHGGDPDETVSFEEGPNSRVQLLMAGPNPFSEGTRLRLDLSGQSQSRFEPGRARVELYNALGRRIVSSLAGVSVGSHSEGARYLEFNWDGRDAGGRTVPAGAYYARIAGIAHPSGSNGEWDTGASNGLTLIKTQ